MKKKALLYYKFRLKNIKYLIIIILRIIVEIKQIMKKYY